MLERGERNVIHLDLDTFFVSVERLINSRLVGRPVIGRRASDRGVGQLQLRGPQYGIHSAMPIRMARQLCADAVILRGDMTCTAVFNIVTDIIAANAPVTKKRRSTSIISTLQAWTVFTVP